MTTFLAFAWEYSRHLRYFEARETDGGQALFQEGTWRQLLRHAPIFYLAHIGTRSPADAAPTPREHRFSTTFNISQV